MTSVAGASRYMLTAIVANKAGLDQASPPNLLSSAAGLSDSLLSIGRNMYGDNGIGLSANARAYNEKFLNETRGGFNAVFGMSTVNLSSVEIMQQTILALRAKLPQSQIAENLRGSDSIGGGISSSNASNARGGNVDTTA